MLGFSAEYVEKITPNEREIFKQMYIQEQEEKKKNRANDTRPDGQTIGNGIQVT